MKTNIIISLVVFSVIAASYAEQNDPSALVMKSNGDITFIKNTRKVPVAEKQNYWYRQPEWQAFYSRNKSWNAEFNETAGLPRRAYGLSIPAPGTDTRDRVEYFIANELSEFSVPLSDLVMQNENSNKKYTCINYYQTYQGLKVLFSNVTFRLTPADGVVMFGLEFYRNINVDLNPAFSAEDMNPLASAGLKDNVVNATVDNGMQILPVETNSGYSFHLVYEVWVETSGKIPGKYYTLVDAHTGKVWYRQNQVHSTVDVTVRGLVTDNAFFPDTATRGLPNLQVTVASTDYFTDENGFLSLTGSSPVSGNFSLQGSFAEVYRNTSSTVSNFNATLNPGTNSVNFNTSAYVTEIAAYYNANAIHKHMKNWTPAGFTNMDFPMEVRVDITTDSCNAFYSGFSLNFYAESSTCLALSLFSDVVYHEYGHGINYEFYSYLGGNFGNSALGEGYADVWAFSLTRNPVLSQGYGNTVGSFIRRYDADPAVYPEDLQGESHADGEIIAGSWWDLNMNLDSMEKMMDIFIGTHSATLSQADGQEGILYRDVLLEALLYNDDDADLSNGTPDGQDICDAFGRHGISLVSNATISHTPVDTVQANSPMVVNAVLSGSSQYLFGVGLNYRVNNNPVWNTMIMTNTGGNNYSGQIPPQQEGTIISYYLGVMDNICGNLSSVIPSGAAAASKPNLPYFIIVGYKLKKTDDFDVNSLGTWTVGLPGDNAITGMWTIDDPAGTYDNSATPAVEVQPEDQHTPGGLFCAVTDNRTGSGIGAYDTDNGVTTLESPSLNLTTYLDPVISYYRWFINDPPGGANPGNDRWVVRISGDGTNWVDVENTYAADNSWRWFVFRVQDFITPTASVKLRFYASDSLFPGQGLQYDGGSIVEAAVDDIQVWEKLPPSIIFQNILPSCPGYCDGSIMATPPAGTPPFAYQWNDLANQTTPTATGLCAGQYQVTITDSLNNSVSSYVTLNDAQPLTGTVTSTNASCGTCSDGTISADISGGSGNYYYLWSDANSQVSSSASGLTAGLYYVTVTDSTCNLTQVISGTIGFTGIFEIKPGEIIIRPNPTYGPLVIEISGKTLFHGRVIFEVINILGEIVFSSVENFDNPAAMSGILRSSPVTIDMSGAEPGIYLLNISDGQNNIRKKFVLH
ncbi:MAG: T9SS type A sorting domain-containing protein [Bacteroidetes bacterium]|nr:T9SS type A sorting domain-containing protein [Bacteroidota bacterium]